MKTARQPLAASPGISVLAGSLATLVSAGAFTVLAIYELTLYPGVESALGVLFTLALAEHRRRREERRS